MWGVKRTRVEKDVGMYAVDDGEQSSLWAKKYAWLRTKTKASSMDSVTCLEWCREIPKGERKVRGCIT